MATRLSDADPGRAGGPKAGDEDTSTNPFAEALSKRRSANEGASENAGNPFAEALRTNREKTGSEQTDSTGGAETANAFEGLPRESGASEPAGSGGRGMRAAAIDQIAADQQPDEPAVSEQELEKAREERRQYLQETTVSERFGDRIDAGMANLQIGSDALSLFRRYRQSRETRDMLDAAKADLRKTREALNDREDVSTNAYHNIIQQKQDRLAGLRKQARASRRAFMENARTMTQARNEAESVKRNPIAQRAVQADSFGEFWTYFSEDPLGTFGQIATESLPLMAPGVVAGTAGGAIGGPGGFAAGMGLGSGMVEVGLTMADEINAKAQQMGLAGKGADDPKLTNDDIRKVLDAHGEEIRREAFARGTAIGLFDAAGGKLATMRMTREAGEAAGRAERVARNTGEAGAQTGVQSTTGAGGEATAQAATGEYRPGEIGAEAVGGLADAIIEVPAAVASGARAPRDQRSASERKAEREEQASEGESGGPTSATGGETVQVNVDEETDPEILRRMYDALERQRDAADEGAEKERLNSALDQVSRRLGELEYAEIEAQADTEQQAPDSGEGEQPAADPSEDETRGPSEDQKRAALERDVERLNLIRSEAESEEIRAAVDLRLDRARTALRKISGEEAQAGEAPTPQPEAGKQTSADQQGEAQPAAETAPEQATDTGVSRRLGELKRLRDQTDDTDTKAVLTREIDALEAEKKKRGRQRRRPAHQRNRIVEPERDDLLTAVQKLGGIDTKIETEWQDRFKGMSKRGAGLRALERPGADDARELDSLAEPLHELGYLESRDKSELEDKLLQAEKSNPVYSNAYDMTAEMERAEADREAGREATTDLPADADEQADAQASIEAEREQTVEESLRAWQEEVAASQDEAAGANVALQRMRERAQRLNPDRAESFIEDAGRQGLSPEAEMDGLAEIVQEAAPSRSQLGGRPMEGVKSFEEFRREQDRGELDGKALGFVDLDNFKALNDTYSHELGDQVIRAFGDTLRQYAGEGNVYRRSGDEFIIRGDDAGALERSLQQAQNDLENRSMSFPYEDGGEVTLDRLRFSVGTAAPGETVDATLRQAEENQDGDKKRRLEQGLRENRTGGERRGSDRRAGDQGQPDGAAGGRRDQPAQREAGAADEPRRGDDEYAAGDESADERTGQVDAFGGRDETAQAVRDADESRAQQAADAPPVESGDGDLFSGGDRQTDIEDFGARGGPANTRQTGARAPQEPDDPSRTDVDAAAHEAATSPANERPQPTEAQQEAGNYRKGDLTVQGFDIAVENPEGSTRWNLDTERVRRSLNQLSGDQVERARALLDSRDDIPALFDVLTRIGEQTSARQGPRARIREAVDRGWYNASPDHYGYFRRTEGRDGDAVDVYVGDQPEQGGAFVIDQYDPETGRFDEHKVMLGYADADAARRAYLDGFDHTQGQRMLGALTPVRVERLRDWLDNGDTQQPFAETEYGDAGSVRGDSRSVARGGGPVDEAGQDARGQDPQQPQSGQSGERQPQEQVEAPAAPASREPQRPRDLSEVEPLDSDGVSLTYRANARIARNAVVDEGFEVETREGDTVVRTERNSRPVVMLRGPSTGSLNRFEQLGVTATTEDGATVIEAAPNDAALILDQVIADGDPVTFRQRADDGGAIPFSDGRSAPRMSALRNLSAEDLRLAEESGGLDVAATAGTAEDNGPGGTGEITLIGGRSIADPMREPAGTPSMPDEAGDQEPQRSVGLDEFHAAAVPDDASAETLAILDRNGIAYRTYPREAPDPGAEQRAAADALRRELADAGNEVLFSFAGTRAATADQYMHGMATRLVDEGADPEYVRRETGWFQGDDGQWRFEVDDSQASLIEDIDTGVPVIDQLRPGADRAGETARLDEVLDHPRLFAAYPDLGGIEVAMMGRDDSVTRGSLQSSTVTDAATGEVTQGGGFLRLSPGLETNQTPIGPLNDVISVLLHEIQHGIQQREGFAQGGSVQGVRRELDAARDARDDTSRRLERTRNERNDQAGAVYRALTPADREAIMSIDEVAEARRELYAGEDEKFWRDTAAMIDEIAPQVELSDRVQLFVPEVGALNNVLRRNVDEWRGQERRVGDIERRGIRGTYQALAGEVEARNTADRQRLNEQDRRDVPPQRTQDTPSADVIVRMNGEDIQADAPANAADLMGDGDRMAADSVRRVTDRLMRDWSEAPPVEVLQSESELPAIIRRRIAEQDAEGSVRGVYREGRVYLVADNLRSPLQAEEAVLHEVVGHYGLRGLLGERFNDFLDTVYERYGDEGLRDIIDEYGLDTTTVEGRRTAAEEKMAALAQAGERTGLVRRFVAQVRSWLRRMGFRLQLTDAEIGAIIEQSRAFVRSGRVARTDGYVVERGESPDGQRPHSVPVTVVEPLDVPPDQLNRTALERFRSLVQGRQVLNPSLGAMVTFSRNTANKLFSRGRRDYRRMSLVDALPELARNAVFYDQAPDRRGRPDITRYRYAVAPAAIGPRTFAVRLVLAENRDGGRRVYDVVGYDVATKESDRPRTTGRSQSDAAVSGSGRGSTGTGNVDAVRLRFTSAEEVKVDDLVRAVNTGEPVFSRQANAPTKPPTDEAFQRWFGDSKVTDEQGNPKVVYHGTHRGRLDNEAQDFAAFDTSPGEEATVDGTPVSGSFFTDDPEVAESYTSGRVDRGGTVYPVYLSLQNPLVVDAKGSSWSDIRSNAEVIADGERIPITKAGRYVGALADEVAPAEDGVTGSITSTDELNQAAQEEGYDGLIVRNVEDTLPGVVRPEAQRPATIYVAFRPQQIKSATGNTGAYSPDNADIRFSREMQRSAQQSRQGVPTLYGRTADGSLGGTAQPDRSGWRVWVKRDRQGNLFEDGPREFTERSPSAARRRLEAQGLEVSFEQPAIERQKGEGLWDAGGFDELGPTTRHWLLSRTRDWLDGFRFWTQDKLIDLKRIQRAITEARGANIPEDLDTYMRESLYHGRTEERIERFRSEHVAPLLRDLQRRDLTLAELDEYVYARHAAERNRRMAEQNPDFDENEGSGMTTDEANEILERFRQEGKVDGLAAVARRIDQMVEQDRSTLVVEGLERPEVVEGWRRMYDHYVPLRAFESDADKPEDFDEGPSSLGPQGRGFNTGGGRSRSALGRRSRAASPIAHVIYGHEKTLMRAEKARVGRSFLRLVQANPNPRLWQINEAETRRERDEQTGLVKHTLVYKGSDDPNTFTVKVGGKDMRVTLHGRRGKRLAQALNNLGADQVGPVISMLMGVNRYLSGINTGYNPEFLVSNFLRDIQTAGINLSGTEADNLKWQILRNVKSAYSGIRANAVRGDTTGRWAAAYEDFKAAGAKTGWIDTYTRSDDAFESLRKQMQDVTGTSFGREPWTHTRRMGRKLLERVQKENLAVENAVRLSAYENARRGGFSEQQAASLAKELTVNFNRKGMAGPKINALYLFFNAAFQGSMRVLQALKSRKTRRVATGIIASQAALTVGNRWWGGEDEDDESHYDNVPDWVKQRNIIVMNPLSDGGYVSVPMPYGYNVFGVIGQEVGDATSYLMGQTRHFEASDSALTVADATLNAFNPITGGTPLQTAMPTIGDPLAQWVENKDWAGRTVYPEVPPYERAPDPAYMRAWPSTSELAVGTSALVNDLSGGNRYRPGYVDVPPEVLESFVEFATGGLGRMGLEIEATASGAATGRMPPWYKVPFLGKVYGDSGQMATTNQYYEAQRQVEYANKEYDGRRLNEGAASAARFYRQEAGRLRLSGEAERADKQVQAISNEIDKVRQSDVYSPQQKAQRIERLENRKERVMQRFLRQYNRTMD